MKENRYIGIEKLVSRIVMMVIMLLSATALLGQHHITGIITDENNGTPVPGVSVYFYLPGGGPLGGSMSDQTGVYNFHSESLEINDLVHLQAWSFCNGEWQTYNYFLTIVSDTTNYSFIVCSDEEPCSADFEYEIDNLEVEFSNLSVGPVYEFYWDFGDGHYSYEMDPDHVYNAPGQYEVSLFISADNNCFDVKTDLITIGENYTISGTAYAGTTPLPQGEVLLYQVGLTMNIIQRQMLDKTGEYLFSVEPYSNYQLLVLPDIDPGVPHFPVYMPTYNDDVMQWQQSNFLHASEDIEMDIHLQSYDEMFHGAGSIKGKVSTQNKDYTDIPIFLKDEGGNYVDYCYPASDGTFIFNEIPIDSYIIFPEKAGKNTDPGFVSLSEDNNTISGVMIYETEYEMEVEYNVGLVSWQKDDTRIYPVPANENVYIESERRFSEIRMRSIYGQLVFSQSNTTNSSTINTSNFKNGTYIFQITYENGDVENFKISINH